MRVSLSQRLEDRHHVGRTQLQTKTWATIQRWTTWCLTSHWFTINAERNADKDAVLKVVKQIGRVN